MLFRAQGAFSRREMNAVRVSPARMAIKDIFVALPLYTGGWGQQFFVVCVVALPFVSDKFFFEILLEKRADGGRPVGNLCTTKKGATVHKTSFCRT